MRDASVYVHFPWCLQKCPYCDFASAGIARDAVPHGAYADAVLRELEWRRADVADRRLVSVFFGGGTPSLWEPRELGRVLAAARAAFGSEADDLEVTVECNPSSLDRARAAALREAGVGRVSIGVQSLDDARLRFLGRMHDAAGALRAVREALLEIPRVSGDLMFGMPGQSLDSLRDEAARLLETGVRHVSAYSLTIEPGTQFGELHRKGRLPMATDDDFADLFLGLEQYLEGRGLGHYEVSNYAVAGEEARHNLHYWRGGAYLGLGAAAVGCLEDAAGGARRWRNDPDPARYMDRSANAVVETSEEALGPDELVREALMLGLRTRNGVDLDALSARTGRDPRTTRAEPLARHLARGNLVLDGPLLRAPTPRWLLLDPLIASLF